jgi:hypothetical protein
MGLSIIKIQSSILSAIIVHKRKYNRAKIIIILGDLQKNKIQRNLYLVLIYTFNVDKKIANFWAIYCVCYENGSPNRHSFSSVSYCLFQSQYTLQKTPCDEMCHSRHIFPDSFVDGVATFSNPIRDTKLKTIKRAPF